MEDTSIAVVSDPIPTTAVPVAPLSLPQSTALEWLTAGEPLGAAADAAGVHRTTLFRWIKSDPHFQAAYNSWRDQVQTAARDRLLSMTDLAVAAVNKALIAGDAKVALTVLKERGLLKSTEVGPTDAAVVSAEAAIEHRNAARRFAQAEMESYMP